MKFQREIDFFYISHRPNKNQHQQYQIQIFHTTMYFWILQPWNCKSVNPFFTTLVWRKEKGVCINFTKIASNGVVTQGFDCHLPHFEPRQTRDRATVPNCTKYGQFLLVCATMGWNWFWSSFPIFMHLSHYLDCQK